MFEAQTKESAFFACAQLVAAMASQMGNGSSEQVAQACAYLDSALLNQDTAKALSQNVKDKCAKLKQLVSSPTRPS